MGASTFVRGSGAPSSTHVSSMAISMAGSFLLGGIALSSSRWRIAWTSRLFAKSPRIKVGPFSPPAAHPARESKASPASTSCWWEWHSKQRRSKIGKICAWKNGSGSYEDGAPSPAASRLTSASREVSKNRTALMHKVTPAACAPLLRILPASGPHLLGKHEQSHLHHLLDLLRRDADRAI